LRGQAETFIYFAPPKEPIRRLAESSPQANEPKKKRPEMKNFVHTYARYTGLIGATVWPKFRTIWLRRARYS